MSPSQPENAHRQELGISQCSQSLASLERGFADCGNLLNSSSSQLLITEERPISNFCHNSTSEAGHRSTALKCGFANLSQLRKRRCCKSLASEECLLAKFSRNIKCRSCQKFAALESRRTNCCSSWEGDGLELLTTKEGGSTNLHDISSSSDSRQVRETIEGVVSNPGDTSLDIDLLDHLDAFWFDPRARSIVHRVIRDCSILTNLLKDKLLGVELDLNLVTGELRLRRN